jgi:hypothetical protein
MHSGLIFPHRLATIQRMTERENQHTCYDKGLRSYGLAGVGGQASKKSSLATMQVARTANRHRYPG